MLVGHYSAALLAKSCVKEASLGLLFLAAQLLDIVFFPLAVLGVEQLRIVPGFTESTPFELPYMPYTHSLLAALVWSLLAWGLALVWFRRQVRQPYAVAVALGLVVFSHWLLDLPVHTPDLSLWGGESPKLGLGLWHHVYLTYALEAGLLLISLWFYMRSTLVASPVGRYAMPALVLFLLASNMVNLFGPPMPTVPLMAVLALASYLGFAALAGWAGKYRVSK